MGLKHLKPTSPGVRFRHAPDFSELTPGAEPARHLLEPHPSKGGRNHYGRITARFRGGGHKRRYRVIDFKRNKIGVPAKVRRSACVTRAAGAIRRTNSTPSRGTKK